MFDLKFYNLVIKTTNALNIKSPIKVMVSGKDFNEKDTNTQKRVIKKMEVMRTRTDTSSIDIYYRYFFTMYAIPHINYFKN